MTDLEIKDYLKIANMFLFVAFLAVAGNYIGLNEDSMTGNFFRGEEPSCDFNRGNYSGQVPLDRCCVYASQKASCENVDGETVCGTESQNYSLNPEAVSYCNQQGSDF